MTFYEKLVSELTKALCVTFGSRRTQAEWLADNLLMPLFSSAHPDPELRDAAVRLLRQWDEYWDNSDLSQMSAYYILGKAARPDWEALRTALTSHDSDGSRDSGRDAEERLDTEVRQRGPQGIDQRR